ncbi:hypothetical protein WJX77_006333 [Trebouxia sp. C0004]
MKRKVWGDVPSHPISDSGSDSRAASPEPAVNSPVDMSTPKATTPHEESRPQSPFQGHAQPDHDSQSDEDAPESQQTGLSSTSNKATNMASEPSLRHGLGEGQARSEAVSGESMNRVASLASGIGGSGFEWNPNPAGQQSTLARNPASAPESNLTFSPSAANDEQMGLSPSSLPIISSGEWTDSVNDFHPSESSIQQIPDEVMFDEEDYSMSHSCNARQEQEEESAPSFDCIQTKAPGLTPLRLTPKSAPEKTRFANPPPPTSFPARDVSAQGGTTPQEVEQNNERQLARRGADFIPSPRTGAIVDELLQGVVSENLAIGDTPQHARQQASKPHGAQQVGPAPTELEALPHGATQVGPAPSELESISHGAEQVEGESDQMSGALRIPQIGEVPLPHGALQVDAMPKLAHVSTGTEAVPEYSMDSPRSTTSAMSGVSMTSQGTPRSPFHRAVGYAEAAVGLTGGAVAAILAGTALVGIGAVALTGGAVLNAVDFPRSPRQAQQTGAFRRSASDTDMSAQTGAEAQQGALPDLPEVSRPALERVSSSAKRQADSSWADSQSPRKRQEVDQSPEPAAAGPGSQAVASDRDADDSMMTDTGGEPASGRLTAEGQGAQHALARDDDAASNSSGGFMSYIPGSHANRASHAGQAPDSYLGDGPAARLASYIPGGATAGRLASYLPGSSTAGRLADYAVSRAEQGFAHYSEHPRAQASSTSAETRGGLASYIPGTEANRASQGESAPELAASQSERIVASQVGQQGRDSDRGTATSDSSKQGTGSGSGNSSSSGGGGIMSYIPGTEANQASTAAQELGLDSDNNSGLARGLASYIPGTQANSASRAEEGPAATSGSSSGTASYVPGAGADRAATNEQSRAAAESPSHAEQGRLAESDRGSSVASGIASYIPGTQANSAAQADSESGSGTGSGLASYILGTQASRENQAPAGTGLASYIPGTEANRAANTARDQSPHSGRGTISGQGIGSSEPASESTQNSTASTPEGYQNVEYSHECHSSSMSEDAVGHVAGMQAGRQAEGRQAHQAASASDSTTAGQSPDTSETKSAGSEQASLHGDAGTDAKPETQQQTQSQRQTQQQTQSHDHFDRGSPEHSAEKEMAEAAPETASAAAPEAASAGAPQQPGLQSGLGRHAATLLQEGAASLSSKDMPDIQLPCDDSQAEWDAHHTQQPALDQGPLPTVAEEPMAEKAAVQASRDTQSSYTQQASPSQTQSQQTQPSQTQPQGNWPHQRSWPHQTQTQLAEPQGPEHEEEARGRLFDMIGGKQGVDEVPSNSQTAGHADSPDTRRSVDAPPEPPLQSEIGQQQAAAVEGRTDRHMDARQGPSTKGLPEETAAKSDVGQQQAASGESHAARHGSSSGRPQTDDTQTFVAQHLVQNQAPSQQESMFAEPLATDRRTHHDRQATDSEEASNDQPQAHHAQTFALQHQINNEAPGNQDSMFAEPLASDSLQHQQGSVPTGQQATAHRLHTRDAQTGVPPGQAGGATEVSRLDEPQSQGSGRVELQGSASQHDSSEQHEEEQEAEHQSLAGRLFELIAQGQGQSESEATRHADSAAQSAAPLRPALHSEVGQQQSAAVEGQTAGHADASRAVTAAGEPEGAAVESDIEQQQANAVDGRAARHGAASEGSSATDAPQEPALQSGIARQAAAIEQGSTSADRRDRDFQQQHSGEPDHPSSFGSPQTADAQTFLLHQQVRNESPGGQASMFAPPLTSDETQSAAAAQQHQPSREPSHDNNPQAFASKHQVNNEAPAELKHPEPLTSGQQVSGSQNFVFQHQMNNASLASQQAVYSEPLTSDRHPSHAQHPEHQASAGEGNEASPSMRRPLTSAGQMSSDQDFALQHSMNNQVPAAATSMYAQPLTSDQQYARAQQQPEQQQHGDSELIQDQEAHGRRQAVSVQQDDGQVPEPRSQQAGEPHQRLAGRLFSSLFGSHDLHPQAESTRSHGEQPAPSPAAESGSHHTQATGAGTRSVVPDTGRSRQQGPESVGDDESMAETDADLHTAQQAQKDALQVEQESLSDSRQSLVQVRESLQHQQPGHESRAAQQLGNDSAAETDAALHTARQAQREALQAEQESLQSSREGLTEVREAMQQHQATEEGASEAGQVGDDSYSQAGTEGESTAETDAALSSAQQAQREAMLVSQNSLNDSRKRLLEVREAMQQQGQEHQHGQDQQYGQGVGQEDHQQAGDGQTFAQDQQPGQHQQQIQGRRSAERQQYRDAEQAGYNQAHVQHQAHPQDQLYDDSQRHPEGQQQLDCNRSMSETDADLHTAQHAQREALQTEQESLQSSRQGLQEVREALQQRSQTGAASHMQEEHPYTEGAYREAATPAQPQEDSWLPVSRAQPSVSGQSQGGFSGSYHISHHIDDSSETSNWSHTPRQQQRVLYDQNLQQQQQQQQQQVVPQYEQSSPHHDQGLPQQQQWQQQPVMPDYAQRPSQRQHAPSHYAPPPSYDQQPSQYEQATSQYPQAQSQPEHFSSQHERASLQHERPSARDEQAFSHFEQAPTQREHLPLQYEQAQEPIQQSSPQHEQALSQHETPPYPEQASPQHEQSAPQQEQRQSSGQQMEAQQAPLYPEAPQQHSISGHQPVDRSVGSGQHPVEEGGTSGSKSFTHAAAESAFSEPPEAERSLEYGGDAEGAAHSTAQQHPAAQADSSSGMRYDWAPPSSLWGRATAAVGSLAAAFTGTSEATTTAASAAGTTSTAVESAAGRAGTPEAASAAPQEVGTAGKVRDETADAVYADTADRNIADTSGVAELQRAGSDYASPDTPQEGYGWSRPATHANFAKGNLTSRPARLRPALPQHWVQAVDERAADSGTPTSARSIPEAPTATGTQLSQPLPSRDFRQSSTDVTSVHHRPEASAPEEHSWPSAQPEHATAVAEALQPTSDTGAVEEPATAGTNVQPARGTNVNDGPVNMAGQSESRDAVKVQQEAAQNSQGWQHAGLGGSVAPATPQADNAKPPQPVPETMLQSQLTGQGVPPKDQSAGTVHAVANHAVHAEPAEDLYRVPSQPGSSSPTAPAVNAAAAARTHSRAPAPVAADGSPYSSYPPEAATPISALGTAELRTTDSSAANRDATQPLGQGYTTAQPEASVTQATPPGADEVSGASSSTSAAAAAAHWQPQSAAMLSLEAMIPPAFELSSSPDSERLLAHAKSAATSTPAQFAFQNAAHSDPTFGSQPQAAIQHVPAEAVIQGTGKGAVSGSRPALRASAPPPAGDKSSGSGYICSQSRQMVRLNNPEVQRQIEQTAAEVQEAVNERGGRQNLSGGVTQEGEALARATGTLRALVAGHVEEAESLSRGLPSHSGTTEKYPSERQVAAMRSVDGTTLAAKTASLERGMEAAFVFATADRAAAMLKALAVGKPLDKMESVPEVAMEGFPSAESPHEFGVSIGPNQVSHTHDQEAPFEVDASEGSFVSAVSHAAPANSVVSDTEYASIADEPADQLPEASNSLGGNGVMARAPSFPTQSPDHHAATAPLVAPDPSLRSMPVDWGSPAPATVSSQAPVQPPTLTPTPFETPRLSLASGPPPTTGRGQPPQPPANQTGASRDTAAASGTHESLRHHAAPVPLGGPIALRSTPVDWGSPARIQPPMSIPSQASAPSVTAASSSVSTALSAAAHTEAARSHVPFSTSSAAAATAPSPAVAATEELTEAAAAAAPGQQALTDDMPAGKGRHSSGQGRAEGGQASGLQPTGLEGGSRGGVEGGEVTLGPEVQAASTEIRGVYARESTSEEADIENVNPQAVTAKHGGLPSSTQQAQAVGPPIALTEAPLLADAKPKSTNTPVARPTPTPGGEAASKQPGAAAQSVLPVASAAGSTANKPFVASQSLSDTSQARVPSAASELRTPAVVSDATASKQANVPSADVGSNSVTDTAIPQASAATANKPFISSEALSDALFGGSHDPASPIRSPRTAQRPTSPFAEASTTAAPAAAAAAASTTAASKGGVEGVLTDQPRFSGLSSKGTSRAERIEEALMSSTSPFSRSLSSEEVAPVMARLLQDKPRGTTVKEEEAQGSAGAATQPGVQSQVVQGVRQGASGAGVAGASKTGEAAKHAGPGGDEIEAAQAASSGATAAHPAGTSTTSAAHVASTTSGAAPAAGQAPARRVAEPDDGKARFVCCSFGGRKAGRKQRK